MTRPIEISKIIEHPEYMEPIEYRGKIEIRGKITRDLVEEISRQKKEPDWMRRLRLRALEYFEKLPLPKWLYGIESIDLEEITTYYVKPLEQPASNWEDLPAEIREIYLRLGLPDAYAKYLAGLTTVLDSETAYSAMKDYLKKIGVIMIPMEQAIRKYPDLVKKYFGKIVGPIEHKFAALHYALWSGGVFVYVPKNVKVPYPVEAFFFVGKELEGQFEHSLIVADEGSELTFIEGCSAPRFKKFSFHDGAVELYAHRKAKISFITVQNWSRNIINFNNKRAIAEEDSYVEWLEGSIGSKYTVTYPSTILRGKGARTSSLVVGIANGPYIKDTGSKAIHAAPNTKSKIISKSISSEGGVNIYRGLVHIFKGAKNSTSYVQCDSLILDEKSKAYTYPIIHVEEKDSETGHEATTGRINDDQIFYLQSRGLSEGQAKSMIVLGYIKDVLKGLPMEYVAMLNRVIQLEFERIGGVG
ncbi:Fe-S cluster assembly protein SufB [Staphylothermus hellenicus]|uniref:FeS assembly protein SufB n=1 Tax=Staphylothermus hellenicus (strain DSM 12710 / JCM 10830 / BK20S6-10-b1 / P8) TaxID=591019 RepID=D7DCC6_STAHD|nr:Fe-S cluster assembly protein SufB [Staphylothermus hellenicus]ADI31823.1 FeS assembly protein SufB [Staphylothermus hellenicus DSM 12710]